MEKELTKFSFGFTPEDTKLLEKIKKSLAPMHGPISNISAIRAALRAYPHRSAK